MAAIAGEGVRTSPPALARPELGRPRAQPWALLLLAGGLLVLCAAVGATRAVSALALVVQAVFVVFFVRHFGFALSAMHTAPTDVALPVVTDDLPSVTVLVACKNEERVVEALAASLVRLDYPRQLLQIIVVDDGSTDRTGELLDDLMARDPRLLALHRDGGGGKSAALNAALPRVTGDVVVVFDADHQPNRDVLLRLVRHFNDPDVAAVQGRCVISNPDDAPLTRLIAVDYLAGYLVNEYGRQAMHHLPAYGGANCAVRTADLLALGGWNEHSVTEDTDLTVRLALAGRRVRYDVTAVDREEGVVTLQRYWRQRYRWARGHQQACRDYRRAATRSPRLSWLDRLEMLMFLHAFHLPVASAVSLAVLALWFTGLVNPVEPASSYLLWTMLFLGPLLELGSGLLVARADRREALVLIWFLPLLLLSAALCTKAWFDGVLGRPYTWVKTQRAGDPVVTP